MLQKNGSAIGTIGVNSTTDGTINVTITSSDVTGALGYTPYSNANPSGYQANVIETVKVNGTALTPTTKTVDISIPAQQTIGDGNMVIQKNGSAVGTFTANQSSASTVNITVTSSDVTGALGYTPYSNANPSGYQANIIETIKVNGTAITPTSKTVDITVGSSGTVGNGDMVIQQNGTAVGTFTANQTDASTVNLSTTQVVWRKYS